MKRTITVKGIGRATATPDQVEIRLSIAAKHMVYEKAMSTAATQIDWLKSAFREARFAEGCLKTTNFNISTEYKSFRKSDGSYDSIFDGYECSHDLKLVFDFSTTRLSAALGAIADSRVNPRVSLDFTVKNPSAVNERILQDAAENARKKAEILCAASGAKLGELIAIDYNWGEVRFVSQAKYSMADCVMAASASAIDIDPDDIDASDSASFVWEIET